MSPNPAASSSHGDSSRAIPNKLNEQFEILGEVSRGGMGVVYKARDRQLGREVAIKVITGPNELTDVMRFRREAQVLAQIQHKNVARIWDFGWHNQTPFLVMEYIEGPTLSEVVREHLRVQGSCPDPTEIARIMYALADALLLCHSQGIVHRDLKPDNIILAKGPGNEDRVVLLDFGVAKRDPTIGPDGRSIMLTETGELLGTPAFMAPEQFSPNSKYGPIGLATDIWGFGATLFFCLTGEYPYPVSNGTIGIFEAMMSGGPKRVQSLNLSIPGWLDLLCAACLRRKTENRPDMKALHWQLKGQLEQEKAKSISGLSLFDSQWHDRETIQRSPKKYLGLLFLLFLLLPPTVMLGIMTSRSPLPTNTGKAELKRLKERLKNNLSSRQNDLENGRELNLRKALKLEAKILKLSGTELNTETVELLAALRLLQAEAAYKSGNFKLAQQHLASAKRKDSEQNSRWLLLSGLIAAKDPSQSNADAIKLLRAGNAENSVRDDVYSTLIELYIHEKKYKNALKILERVDEAARRYPRFWFLVATKLPNIGRVSDLVRRCGERTELSPELELAFLQAVKYHVSRDDIAKAIKTSETLLKRKRHSTQRDAIQTALSDWMCGRFGHKGWGDHFFEPKQLKKSLLICSYLSREFSEAVSEKLIITFGDFIIFCLGPAHKDNSYKALEELGSHLPRWRPREARSWLIYTELVKRCFGFLPMERRMAIARTFPKANNASSATQARMILRFRYSIFYRMAGLHKEGLNTIPMPSLAEQKHSRELSANAYFQKGITSIELANIEQDKRAKWKGQALKSFKEAISISPDIMGRTEILLRIGMIQRENSTPEKAIQSYLLAIEKLEMKIEVEHRWSHLLFEFLHAIQKSSTNSISRFRQKLLARFSTRRTAVPWMFERLLLFIESLEAWSVDKPEQAIIALKKLKGELAKTQEKQADQLLMSLSKEKWDNASIMQQYRALAPELHRN